MALASPDFAGFMISMEGSGMEEEQAEKPQRKIAKRIARRTMAFGRRMLCFTQISFQVTLQRIRRTIIILYIGRNHAIC